MSLFDIANVLSQYVGASATNPPPNVQQDFERVSQNAPSSHLAEGLTQAFHSNETPAFGQMIANLFSQSNPEQRAGILSHLLPAAGPGLASGIGGELASLLRSGVSQVTPEQASQVSPEAVQQLAEHAKQNNPSIVEQASSFYAQHPKVVQALGAGALALIMSHISQQR
jgi:hypothetical protein